MDLVAVSAAAWPLALVARWGEAELVADLLKRFGHRPGAAGPAGDVGATFTITFNAAESSGGPQP